LILSIQYLRAFAALTVVWLHAVYGVPGASEHLGAPFFGGSGVDVFFVISGFIMVAITARDGVSAGRFLLLRIVRVVPLYWLATLVAVTYGSYSADEFVKSCLFAPYAATGPQSIAPIVPNGWTLNYEMFFYVLFAASLMAPKSLRVPGLVALLALLVMAGRLFGPFSYKVFSVYTSPLLLEFAGGMIVAQAWLKRAAPRSWPLALIALGLGLYSLGASHSRVVIMGGSFLVVAAATHPRFVSLSNRPLLELGNASYSIYLSHPFVMDGLDWITSRMRWNAAQGAPYLHLAVTLISCLVLGTLCYRFVERPLITRLREVSHSKD